MDIKPLAKTPLISNTDKATWNWFVELGNRINQLINKANSVVNIPAHKSTHATGGSDVLTPADIGAASSSIPLAVARCTTTQAVAATTFATVNFQGAYINTGSMYNAAYPTRITVPKSGKYSISGSIWISAASPSERRLIYICVNGGYARRAFDGLWGCNNDGTLPFPEVILSLNANDYIEMQVYSNNAITTGGAGLNGVTSNTLQVRWVSD